MAVKIQFVNVNNCKWLYWRIRSVSVNTKDNLEERADDRKMIEINAKLVREQKTFFLCGEIVECFISFTHPTLPEYKIAQSNKLENLAWATAQIHCYCARTNDDKSLDSIATKNTLKSKVILSAETALNTQQGQGNTVLETEPKILFCDLRLSPGETKSYLFKETLPMSGPPTYRGTSVRYFYKITIATQKVGAKVQALHLPIRVLSLPTIIKPDEIPALCNETTDELSPTNPFLEKRKNLETKLELALHHLQNVTARRRPNFYLISNKRGRVGRFCLFKQNFKLGEDIVGTLDFSCRTVRCVQVSVTLQCEEILLRNAQPTTTASNNIDTKSNAADNAAINGKIMNFTKHHEVCLGLIQTQMILPVPLHVTPTFTTNAVDVRWRLHFEFVTTNNELKDNDYGNKSLYSECRWQAPLDVEIETMVWNLPVTLYPTAPMQVLQQQPAKYTAIIK